MVGLSFAPGLNPGTPTHRGGNQLDGIWTRNLQVVNTLVSEDIDEEVSDHNCILATIRITGRQLPAEPNRQEMSQLSQAQIRNLFREVEVLKYLGDNLPDITS